jgi:hypothetical protein
MFPLGKQQVCETVTRWTSKSVLASVKDGHMSIGVVRETVKVGVYGDAALLRTRERWTGHCESIQLISTRVREAGWQMDAGSQRATSQSGAVSCGVHRSPKPRRSARGELES